MKPTRECFYHGRHDNPHECPGCERDRLARDLFIRECDLTLDVRNEARRAYAAADEFLRVQREKRKE